VDLNAEAIQICQLSLWIKTAARGKRLTSLDHTIREGNSIISDPAVHPKAFDWQAAFPEVFAQGGFDVVVGNPPYIRQELLTPYKPCLPGGQGSPRPIQRATRTETRRLGRVELAGTQKWFVSMVRDSGLH
jgi:hypothetical protein